MNVPASLRSDQVAVMPWIGWPLCTGLDGRNGVDQVAGITGMRKAVENVETVKLAHSSKQRRKAGINRLWVIKR
jgi:hypothetical protein